MEIDTHQITEVINRQEADDFLRGLKIAFEHMTPAQLRDVYLYDYDSKAVVISFDGNWHPFFGFKYSFNEKEDRIYIQSGGVVLRLIRSRFKCLPHAISGGRVFLTRQGVHHKNKNFTEDTLCQWIWLGETLDIVNDIRELYWQVKGNKW